MGKQSKEQSKKELNKDLQQGQLTIADIQKIYTMIKEIINSIQKFYLLRNINHNINHLASSFLLEILPKKAIELQKINRRDILPMNQTVPRLTGYFHQLKNKKFRCILRRQQKIVQDALQIMIGNHKVINYQVIANLAKKITKHSNFLPSITWSRKFLKKRPILKRKIFQLNQSSQMKKQSQISLQDEIKINEDKVNKSFPQPTLKITPIQSDVPEQTRQKKKYTIERKQQTIQNKVQVNQIQDELQILSPIADLAQESNHSPLICHLRDDFNIEQALAQQQQEKKNLPCPLVPRKF